MFIKIFTVSSKWFCVRDTILFAKFLRKERMSFSIVPDTLFSNERG